MAKKASLSTSNLARPDTLIHALAANVQDYIYMPEPEPFYAVLGTVAANMVAGIPVWLMLVGGASSGKTTLVSTVGDVPRVHKVSNVTGPGSFLSAVGKKERTKEGDGGLLRRTGDRGLWVFKDFSTSVLTMPREAQTQTIGVLREVFDGGYTRSAGSDGGRSLEWDGKVGLLGAGTAAVDKSAVVNQNLGERWLYYRLPEKEDYFGECMRALGNKNPEAVRAELRHMVAGFFTGLDLEWGCRGDGECSEARKAAASGTEVHACKPERETRTLRHVESTRIAAMAALGSRMRSALTRDPYLRNEVIDVPQKEAPPRLAEELGQLYLGLDIIGLGDEERWRLVGKVALDSAPQLRVTLFKTVWTVEREGQRIGVEDLAAVLQCGEVTVRRHLKDMEVFGVVRKVSDGEVRLGEWARRQIAEAGWTD